MEAFAGLLVFSTCTPARRPAGIAKPRHTGPFGKNLIREAGGKMGSNNDVNGDGQTDASDIQLVINAALGL